MKLAQTDNPEKESKNFSIAALVLGIASLFIWFLGIGGLAFGIRGAILSSRISNKKYLTFSIIGIALGIASLGYFYLRA